MTLTTGKALRLGRILRPETGRSVAIAYSHGVLLGPIEGMRTRNEMEAMMDIFQQADAVMVAPGQLSYLAPAFIGRDRPGLILQVDWQNVGRALRGDLGPSSHGRSVAMMTAEQALAAGADAVMTYLWMGGHDPELEAIEIERNAQWAQACHEVGLPLMIESRGFGNEKNDDGSMDLPLLSLHTRVAADLGADLIKTKFSGDAESFRQITAECSVPILVAGGSRVDTAHEAVEFAAACVDGGAAGVIFGRNIFQFDDVAAQLERTCAVVHGPPPAQGDRSSRHDRRQA